MYLSGHIVGLSYLSFMPPVVIPTAFEQITIYGQQTVDFLWIKNKILTDAEIEAITLTEVPVWNPDTIFLANYDNSINAGNIVNLSNPIISWTVQRQEATSLIRQTIASVVSTVSEYTDYTISANKTYQYYIFPLTAIETGEPLESDAILADFYNWSLADPTTNTIFIFDLNLESGDILNETDRCEYQTFSKFNKISRGERNFIKGGINCLAGYIDVNGVYQSSIIYLASMREIINNGNTKYLKSRLGDIWAVDTFNFKYKYMDTIANQPQNISFEFIEIAEVV
jgi:hypothetical protein